MAPIVPWVPVIHTGDRLARTSDILAPAECRPDIGRVPSWHLSIFIW